MSNRKYSLLSLHDKRHLKGATFKLLATIYIMNGDEKFQYRNWNKDTSEKIQASYADISQAAGISKSSFYTALDELVDAKIIKYDKSYSSYYGNVIEILRW